MGVGAALKFKKLLIEVSNKHLVTDKLIFCNETTKRLHISVTPSIGKNNHNPITVITALLYIRYTHLNYYFSSIFSDLKNFKNNYWLIINLFVGIKLKSIPYQNRFTEGRSTYDNLGTIKEHLKTNKY